MEKNINIDDNQGEKKEMDRTSHKEQYIDNDSY